MIACACLLASACGGGGANVSVPPPDATLAFSASPGTVASNGSSMLTWTSTNATSCAASGGWSGSKATSGSESTGALTATTTYTLQCDGAGASVTRSATVTVSATPAPTVTLTANPNSVSSGGASILTWSSTDATTCTATGGWTGAKPTNGSQSTGALTASTSFTLTCSGAGGSTGRTVTVTVTSSTAMFPLHTEVGKRYLIDAQGNPFLIQGDAPWSLIVRPTSAQAEQYLEDRRLKGFNTVLVNLIEHKFADAPPKNANGDAPFLTPGDYATPNEAYFAHAEDVINLAAAKGILVLLTPSYMGYNGGDEGWYQEMTMNGATKLRTYGQYVANRLGGHDNILWVEGGDFNPPEKSLLRAIVNGIRDVDTAGRLLHTFHGNRGTSALSFLGTSEAWLGVNDIYTDGTSVVANAFTEYNRSTMPFFLIEAVYENEGVGGSGVRTQAYQAVLSGASGQVMGNNPIWLFGGGWQSALDSAGARTLTQLRNLFAAHSWTLLQPDTSNALLTSGVSSGANRAAASRAIDGSFALVYTPSVRALTINLAQLTGPRVSARWYDPGDGAYATVTGSPFTASGGMSFTPTGNNSQGDGDWVLVLESTP